MKKIKIFLALCFFALFIATCVAPQTSHALGLSSDQRQSIDAYVESIRKESSTPNISIGVIRDGSVVYTHNYGESIGDKNTFILGSMSKPMTAYGVMLLVQDGRLRLDDKVAKYLPDYEIAKSQVTIQNLMNHTSGISRKEGVAYVVDYARSVEIAASPYKNKQPNEARLGTYEYSNTNYILLGLIIERMSRQSYADFMRERVFEPLGMLSASADPSSKIVQGYTSRFGFTVKNKTAYNPGAAPAGYIHATAGDVAKFLVAQNSGSPLYKKYNDMMFNERVSQLDHSQSHYYGLGWSIFEQPGKERGITHGGTVTGFKSFMGITQQTHNGVIVLTNKMYLFDHTSLDTIAISNGINEILAGKEAPGPGYSTEIFRLLSVFLLLVSLLFALWWSFKRRKTTKRRRLRLVLGILLIVVGVVPAPLILYLYDVELNFSGLSIAWAFASDLVVEVALILVLVTALGVSLIRHARPSKRVSKKSVAKK